MIILYLQGHSVVEDGIKKLPVSLFFEEEHTEDAFSRTEVVMRDVAEVLKDEGFIIRPRSNQSNGITAHKEVGFL